jgi:hypothetical protein
MAGRQIADQLRQQLEADKKPVQWILVELIGAREQIVEKGVLALDVTDQEDLGEFSLILEMIEKSALCDADGGDQLLDRGGREAFVEDRALGRIEDALARISALPLLRPASPLLRPETLPQVQLARSAGATGAIAPGIPAPNCRSWPPNGGAPYSLAHAGGLTTLSGSSAARAAPQTLEPRS